MSLIRRRLVGPIQRWLPEAFLDFTYEDVVARDNWRMKGVIMEDNASLEAEEALVTKFYDMKNLIKENPREALRVYAAFCEKNRSYISTNSRLVVFGMTRLVEAMEERISALETTAQARVFGMAQLIEKMEKRISELEGKTKSCKQKAKKKNPARKGDRLKTSRKPAIRLAK